MARMTMTKVLVPERSFMDPQTGAWVHGSSVEDQVSIGEIRGGSEEGSVETCDGSDEVEESDDGDEVSGDEDAFEETAQEIKARLEEEERLDLIGVDLMQRYMRKKPIPNGTLPSLHGGSGGWMVSEQLFHSCPKNEAEIRDEFFYTFEADHTINGINPPTVSNVNLKNVFNNVIYASVHSRILGWVSEYIRRGLEFPDHYYFKFPSVEDCPFERYDEGWIAVPLSHFRCGIRFELHKFVVAILKESKCCLYQLSPQAITCVTAFIARCAELGWQPNTLLFWRLFKLMKSRQKPLVTFQYIGKKYGPKWFCIQSSYRGWHSEWFWVKGGDLAFLPPMNPDPPATREIVGISGVDRSRIQTFVRLHNGVAWPTKLFMSRPFLYTYNLLRDRANMVNVEHMRKFGKERLISDPKKGVLSRADKKSITDTVKDSGPKKELKRKAGVGGSNQPKKKILLKKTPSDKSEKVVMEYEYNANDKSAKNVADVASAQVVGEGSRGVESVDHIHSEGDWIQQDIELMDTEVTEHLSGKECQFPEDEDVSLISRPVGRKERKVLKLTTPIDQTRYEAMGDREFFKQFSVYNAEAMAMNVFAERRLHNAIRRAEDAEKELDELKAKDLEKVKEQEDARADLKRKVNELATIKDNLEKDLEAERTKVFSLETDKMKLTTNLTSYQANLATARTQIEGIIRENERLKELAAAKYKESVCVFLHTQGCNDYINDRSSDVFKLGYESCMEWVGDGETLDYKRHDLDSFYDWADQNKEAYTKMEALVDAPPDPTPTADPMYEIARDELKRMEKSKLEEAFIAMKISDSDRPKI